MQLIILKEYTSNLANIGIKIISQLMKKRENGRKKEKNRAKW